MGKYLIPEQSAGGVENNKTWEGGTELVIRKGFTEKVTFVRGS